MPANTGSISLELVVDDKGQYQIKRFTQGATRDLTKFSGTIRQKVGGAVSFVLRGLTSWKTMLGGMAGMAGLGLLAKSSIEVASGFEKMRMSLDTLTQGQGAQTLDELNRWALTMPVNTEKAIQAFTMMRAMGLNPTIAQMTTLVDTMSALGGSADTLEGIARALGQMATKGKVSAEELMQLAERGVPVFDILRERFGEVETSSLDAGEAIGAIFQGLEQRFGGQSEKMQSAWAGMVESLKSYWTEFRRLVMESGPFDKLKEMLGQVVGWVTEAFQTGKLEEWAEAIGEWILKQIDAAQTAIKGLIGGWDDFKKKLEAVIEVLKTLWGWASKAVGWVADLAKGIGLVAARLSLGENLAVAPTAAPETVAPMTRGVGDAKTAWTRDRDAIFSEIQGGATYITNNFSQSMSKNDILDVTGQQARQANRG